jgi:hypothetical protein
VSARPLAVALLALALPIAAAAQQPRVSVEGRVLDQSTGLGVAAAAVELEGYGVRATADDGSFRFEDVGPGTHTVWVVAYGYRSASRTLSVSSDLSVTVSIRPAPVPIEGVAVAFIDFEGRVRDPEKDFFLVDAAILTNQGRSTGTDAHGRFEIEGVLESVPLQVTVEAFGYLPLDTVLVPREDERHLFDLRPDPIIQAQIDARVVQLEERAAPHFGSMFHDLNRDDLLEYAGAHTVRSMIEFEFRRLNRIALIIVDGEKWSLTAGPLEELFALLPEELQRIEFRQRRGCVRPTIDVYIYTRDYMSGLVALAADAELPPVYDESRFATCGVPRMPTQGGGIFQVTR